jgi:GNAT superfamily N-acetyltransferase
VAAPAPVVVRPVAPGDYPAWKVLWDGYNAFYGRAGPTALPDETTRVTWTRFLDSNEPVHAMVAEASGEILGLGHFLFHRSTIDISPVCYLQDLFTAGSARGRGVGRALIEAACRQARAAGTTASIGTPGKRTSKRCGYMTRSRRNPVHRLSHDALNSVSGYPTTQPRRFWRRMAQAADPAGSPGGARPQRERLRGGGVNMRA